jgi:thymidylate kinase
MIDLVISGPDMSGTGTQVDQCIAYFQSIGKKVRDIRGTEMDALFHATIFSEYNQNHTNFQAFLTDEQIPQTIKEKLSLLINNLMIRGGTNQDLQIASMIDNSVSTYIHPDSADVWIMEEPTKRGAGQVNRTIEQHRSEYESSMDAISAAYAHQTYRMDEFLRFRKELRRRGKIIVRSRSEESACYQVFDSQVISSGINREQYITLPGHKIAFSNPPTHIFIVCSKQGWTPEQYVQIKKERNSGRFVDDYEKNIEYQILVNDRYRSDWIDQLYKSACGLYGSRAPIIKKISLYDSIDDIQEQMQKEIERMLREVQTLKNFVNQE